MALYFIGLGLGDKKGITLNGLESLKKCDMVYLESYTSVMDCSKEDMEKFYGKKILPADRNMVESDDNEIIRNSRTKNVALLVCGDPLVATTHIDLFLRARKEGVECKVMHNSSIICAVGSTGLQVYKFGKTTSIPFENESVQAPYDVLGENLSLGMHTLFLLDLRPEEEKFMSVNDAIKYLIKIELKRNKKFFTENTFCVGCARIGTQNQIMKYGRASDISMYDFGKPMHCLIVPGKMHFMEEEALRMI